MNVERFRLEDEPMTKQRFNDLFGEWSILLGEMMEIALDTNWGKKFEWDTATSFECLEDEVTRIENVCILHDFIAEIPTETLVSAINREKDYTEVKDNVIDFMVWLTVKNCDLPARELLDNIDIKQYIAHRKGEEDE